MRVVEYLKFRGRLKGVYGRKLRSRVDEVMSLCGLADVSRRIVGQLSKGYRQRIGLADSLVHEPELLILDEPTIGLDPNQIRNIRNVIKSLAEKHTVLLSSHLLSEVDMICGRVMIINKGRIIASDTPENLVGLMKGNIRVVAVVRGDSKAVVEKAALLPGVIRTSCEQEGEWARLLCECAKGSDVSEHVSAMAAANKWSLRELRSEKENLEDVFVALTAGGAADVSFLSGRHEEAVQS
jgi:ABC-2 type transport system ATP-binding protein